MGRAGGHEGSDAIPGTVTAEETSGVPADVLYRHPLDSP